MQSCNQVSDVFLGGFAYGFMLGSEYSSGQKSIDEYECLPHLQKCTLSDQVVFTKESIPISVSSTTEHNACIKQILSEIDEYYDLPEGWDNESEEKTNSVCLDLAKKFVNLLQSKHKIPVFSAATGEEVALYWHEPAFYFIIHFFQNNSLRYFAKTDNSQSSGKILFFSDTIPQEIEMWILKK